MSVRLDETVLLINEGVLELGSSCWRCLILNVCHWFDPRLSSSLEAKRRQQR